MLEDILRGASLREWHSIALDQDGWPSICRQARRLSRKLLHSTLRVNSGNPNRPNTLSSVHGRGPFPLHTDKAFVAEPPRFIILANPTDQEFTRPTLVLGVSQCPADFLENWHNSVWQVNAHIGQVSLKGRTTKQGVDMYRWDSDFLVPSNKAAQDALEGADELTPLCEQISWVPRSAIIIDNWRVLHGRGGSDGNDSTVRSLERLEVWI